MKNENINIFNALITSRTTQETHTQAYVEYRRIRQPRSVKSSDPMRELVGAQAAWRIAKSRWA